MGVERLPLIEGRLGGLADESGRHGVAFTEPERHDARIAEARERDAAQAGMACRSGGEHRTIHRRDLPHLQVVQPTRSLRSCPFGRVRLWRKRSVMTRQS